MRGRWAVVWATLVKVFPAVLGVGLVFHEIGRLWRGRSLAVSRATLRTAVGASLGLALLGAGGFYGYQKHAAKQERAEKAH